jgi:hypothetical protein
MVDCSATIPDSFREELATLRNIHVFNDMPGVWGGASLVAATTEAMRRALKLSQDWTAFINLSGSDVPMMSQEAIMQVLADRRNQKQTTFIADFGQREFSPYVTVDNTIHESSVIPFRSDLAFHVFGQARRLFGRDGGSPVTRPEERISINVYENLSQKALYMRPLFGEEQKSRLNYFTKYPFHFGRQWFVLERKLCEFASESDMAALTFEILKTTLIPDECYFQTLLHSSECDTDQVVTKHNFRYFYGEPCKLTDNDFDKLIASNAFFARKLQDPHCSKIIDHAWKNTYNA